MLRIDWKTNSTVQMWIILCINRSSDVLIFPDFAGSEPTERFYRQSCVDFSTFLKKKKMSGKHGIWSGKSLLWELTREEMREG